jgi:hypothetical protein
MTETVIVQLVEPTTIVVSPQEATIVVSSPGPQGQDGSATVTIGATTTLAAGSYIITGIVESFPIAGASTYSGTPRNSYSVTSYANNIVNTNVLSDTPTFLKLTTSDTVYFSAGAGVGLPWQWTFYGSNNGMENRVTDSQLSYMANNANIDKYIVAGFAGWSGGTYRAGVLPGWYPPQFQNTVNSDYNNTVNVYTPYQTDSQWYPKGVGYVGNFYWVLDGREARFYRSTDGTTWSTLTQGSGTYEDLCYNSSTGYYCAVTVGTTSTTNIASSTNGITWATRTGAHNLSQYSVTAGGGLFVAVGNTSIQTSTDSITWTSRTIPTAGAVYYRVAYDATAGGFFAIAVNQGLSANGAFSTIPTLVINTLKYFSESSLVNPKSAKIMSNSFSSNALPI